MAQPSQTPVGARQADGLLPAQVRLTLINLFAGAASGAIVKTGTAPLERVKILHQIDGMHGGSRYGGVWNTLRVIVREEGVRALFKGNMANVVRVIPVYALKFSFNDRFKDWLRRHPGEELGVARLMVAGSLAGLFQTAITYPLDFVRTRLSLNDSKHGVRYRGILDCFGSVVRSEGFLALYKGFAMTIYSATPYVALQMTFYDLLKRYFKRADGTTTVYGKMACGTVAGLAAQTITFPGDTVKRRMQLAGMGGAVREYSSNWDCIVKMWRREGPRSFFQGLNANCIRSLPATALQFMLYETVNKRLGVAES